MISICNLSKAYGNQVIFDHVNYNFPSQGLFCLLGASGCGKSTLLNLLAGFDSDYEGSITVYGTPITDMNQSALCAYRKSTIGFIFQDYNLVTGYSVLENILLPCTSNNKEAMIKKATQFLEKLNLADKIHEQVEHLSGGQKQRVAIIRSLMNDPTILLADEPTGSLDRKNATEIMQILKEIAASCLVLVITHDKKICTFADECLSIENKQIVGTSYPLTPCKKTLDITSSLANPIGKLAKKNLKVHWKSFLSVCFGIALGILTFLLSLSSGNIMQSSITDFKEKNIAFNNGYIKADQDIEKGYSLLQDDEHIADIYHQYILHDITLQVEDHVETMAEKYPMAKASEKVSYGTMPRKGKKEIALSPSLAKKFDSNIAALVGKELQFQYQDKKDTILISGIFNAGYDDFFLSSDIEQSFYTGMDKKEAYSISYDVKSFEDVVLIDQMLSKHNIHSINFSDEVSSLQLTFENLTHLFTIVSLLILSISVFISIVLLVKLRNTRYREIGLLSALGFQKREISAMLYRETLYLACITAVFNFLLLCIAFVFLSKFNITISQSQYIISIIASILLIFIIGGICGHKLIVLEPARALRT